MRKPINWNHVGIVVASCIFILGAALILGSFIAAMSRLYADLVVGVC